MKIRNKILLYFSTTSIFLVGIMIVVVYLFFSELREKDFQQRQKEKIITTLRFISEIKKNEHELTEAIDKLSINSLLNEKLLIFDNSKKLIYSSLDDLPINYSKKLLDDLSEQNIWIEQKDGLYDIVGIHFKVDDKNFYGISKAYDELGYNKLSALGFTLTIAFFIFSALTIVVSVYISNKIAYPISNLTKSLSEFKIGREDSTNLKVTNTLELDYLNLKFNELVKRVNNSYEFQKNVVNHISHQLKTPISVLTSELERLKSDVHKSNLDNYIYLDFDKQINKTKSLAEIINVLLEISKIEAGQNFNKQLFRIDEIIFDCIEELNILYPNFSFEINYMPVEADSNLFLINGNVTLFKQALINTLNNSVVYNTSNLVEIKIDATILNELKIYFINAGNPILENEQKYLFTHFFRGENSRNKIGFGLGLTLTKSIIELHEGKINYFNPVLNTNVFEIVIPKN